MDNEWKKNLIYNKMKYTFIFSRANNVLVTVFQFANDKLIAKFKLHLIALLFIIGCGGKDPLPATGCWIGINKADELVLIGCYTEQQYINIETSTTYWSQNYSNMQYVSGKTCSYCQEYYK